MTNSPLRRHKAIKVSLRDHLPLSMSMSMTAAAALLVFSPPVQAAPQGGTVVSGTATISKSGNVTDINQSTGRAIINWQSFSIAAPETVNFHQPSSSSVTLNRVIGNEKSIIDGALNANGKVYLVNSAGVLIGKGASVNTAGLVASTLNIRDDDFNAGRNVFQSTGGAGEVTNLGTITVTSGGYVALLGKTVSNQGVISATKGTVTLGGGSKVTLNFNGDSLVSVSVDEGALNALVENRQAIYADGGTVILTAKAADELLAAQVNNDGLIQARTIDDLKGSIQLYAHGGTANVAGTLDASAPIAGDGGFIETSGAKVRIADSAVITTLAATGKGGTWLIDPDGYTIAATGGDITGAALGARLDTNGNVTILSTDGSGAGGNIDVNDAVSWSSAGILTLNATNSINVNKSITASGAGAGLAMVSGSGYSIDTANGASVTLSGTGASLSINGQGYTLIRDMAGLAAISGGGGYYALAKDLDALGTTYTGAVVSSFTGTLAGLGHTVSNMTISSTSGSVGLIGTLGSSSATTAAIRDIGVVNASVTSTGNFVGGLVGLSYGKVSNAYVTGSTVTGVNNVGGLVGQNQRNTISNSHADATVTGVVGVGGLVGTNSASGTNGIITNSYSGGTVQDAHSASTQSKFGGLVGNNTGSITNSYSTANVTVTNATQVGGLIGYSTPNSSACCVISDVSASGAVNVTWTIAPPNGAAGSKADIGGLIGNNTTTLIRGSASGNVTVTNVASSTLGAASYVGGLIGINFASVSDSYATGTVSATGSDTVGGLVGNNNGTITNSHASGNVNARQIVGGLAGANSGTIDHGSASGNVTGWTDVGGLAGVNQTGTFVYSYISNSSATGNVTATGNPNNGIGVAGGLVGTNAGSITGSTASGDVRGVNGQTGGLVGWNRAPVSNAVGGTVTGSSASGSVTGGDPNGDGIGFDGNPGGVSNNSYHDAKAEAAALLLADRKSDATQQANAVVASNVGNAPASVAEVTGAAGGPASRRSSVDDRIAADSSSSYSVNIKSVEVDGVRFNLDEGEAPGSRK